MEPIELCAKPVYEYWIGIHEQNKQWFRYYDPCTHQFVCNVCTELYNTTRLDDDNIIFEFRTIRDSCCGTKEVYCDKIKYNIPLETITVLEEHKLVESP